MEENIKNSLHDSISDDIKNKAKNIKLVIFDVDGVLTDGSLYFDNQGQEVKAFNSKDGHGMRLLLENGVEVAFITGRNSELLLHRAKNLQIKPEFIYQGYRDKLPAFLDLLNKTGLNKEHIAYIGDDVMDLPIMSQIGFSVAVADANWFVKQHTDWQTSLGGGRGAVRELCELILDAQGKLDALYEAYLQK
jgi:3-deoxy-D-manno-octulosonate 8-phosphate phosphatase (KDO 8-P phosphatase)